MFTILILYERGSKSTMLSERYDAIFGAWQDIWIREGWRVQRHCVTGDARTLDSAGTRVASGTQTTCLAYAKSASPQTSAKRAAILLHGLWNSPGIMSGIAERLAAEGWATANICYPSRRLPLAAHAQATSRVAAGLADDGATDIALIGHSLGGLVARAAMAHAPKDGWNPTSLVLIGSPARGSAIAGRFQNLPGFNHIVGACAPALTPAGAAPIPPPACPKTLVIAGGNGAHGYNPLLPGDDDGLIAVAETRLPGHETAFTRVRALHKTLPLRPETIAACCGFLGR
jgi:pimeloyl-ACP methyl ester carboxylesterase